MSGTYLISGGPDDGKLISKAALPDWEEGAINNVRGNNDRFQANVYRRQRDRLVFLESVDLVEFVGGPQDGQLRRLDTLVMPPGHDACIPNEDKTIYAWYRPEDRRLRYIASTKTEDMELAD